MTRQEFIQLIYQEKQPDIQLILKSCTFKQSPKELPDKPGNYLVFHLVYGWCIYGYTLEHKWGADDEYINKLGHKQYKITYWTDLSFLEKEIENTTRNI